MVSELCVDGGTFCAEIWSGGRVVQKNVGHKKMGLGEDAKFYINANLCPAYKNLAYNCRLLKKQNLIADTWSRDGKVKIKLNNNNEQKLITHEIDLVKLFPDFKGFTFSPLFYSNFLSESRDIDACDDCQGW